MNRRPLLDRLRFLAPVLAVVCLLSGLVSPFLDAADQGSGPVLESRHDPASCPRGHDHTICTQIGQNLGFASHSPQGDLIPIGRHESDPGRVTDPAPRGGQFLPIGPRAPPRI